jgi:hypothetical protein
MKFQAGIRTYEVTEAKPMASASVLLRAKSGGQVMEERTGRAFQWLKGRCNIEFGTPDGEAMEKICKRILDMKDCMKLLLDDVGCGEGENDGFIDCEIAAFKIREAKKSLEAMSGPKAR